MNHIGGSLTIRLTSSADAAALLALQHRLDEQSSFMLLEPGERHSDSARVAQRLSEATDTGSFDLVAMAGDELSGWLHMEVPTYGRVCHVGHVVLGVDANHVGQGIGSALLERAVAESGPRGVRRIELTVMTDNHRAIRLYLSAGFVVEGLRRQAIVRNGAAVDEYYMARLLDDGPVQ